MSEAALQQAVRLEAARMGWTLWRNNRGDGTLDNGQFLRWGLANDSKALNERIKSSDLIGWDDRGRFVAVECKAPSWRFTGTARETAQQRFIDLVRAAGGRGGFVTDPKQLMEL